MAGKAKKTLSNKLELAQAENFFKDEELLLSPPVQRAAYSDRMAWMMACMSQLAYDGFEQDPKTLELFKVKLKGGGFDLLATFNDSKTDTQAFLASCESYVVLAFRGTEVSKRTDFKTDAEAVRVKTIEGQVHVGFLDAYRSVEKDILKNLLTVNALPLYITGHSLGAALATVATHSIEIDPIFKDQIAACYTFGSPRVGDLRYDETFKSPIYRIVNTTDIVTVVPLFFGYTQIGDVRFLEREPGQFRRAIPALQRAFFFLMAIFRLFGPLVGDHAIVEYKRKLEAIAIKRNPMTPGITRK